MPNINYRIESVYTLQQPLSHIGSSESTSSFLNTIRIVNDAKPAEVFAYTGNAIRGEWRDCGAKYMLNRLNLKVPKKAFHLLFSGGSIGGEQSADIEQAKALRDNIPFVSLFGGGVGNQILAGKITQTFALPVCAETSGIIPKNNRHIEYASMLNSWREMTGEIEFSRKDDAKTELGDTYMLQQEDAEKQKQKDGPATQMRYTVEYLTPGTQLWHAMHISCSNLELGALVASIKEWSKLPVLGGMAGKGFGVTNMDMDIVSQDGQEQFITVADGNIILSAMAQDMLDKYDKHLNGLAQLEATELLQMIG